MAYQFKVVDVDGNRGWQTFDLDQPLANGQQINISILGNSIGQSTQQPAVFQVRADAIIPTQSGIVITKGEKFRVTASAIQYWNWFGSYVTAQGLSETAGPTFTLPGYNKYSLIGRIKKLDTDAWQFMGLDSGEITATQTGMLEFWMNDEANYYSDNTGNLDLTVTFSGNCANKVFPSLADNLLVASIGTGSPFSVDDGYSGIISGIVPGNESIRLGLNGCCEGTLTVVISIDAPGVPVTETSDCSTATPINTSNNPIKLRDGDKILSETDILIQSLAGQIDFTRHYTQSRQNHAAYQFMGLGWSHNHALQLSVTGSVGSRKVEIYLADGGILKFTEHPGTPNTFDPSISNSGYLSSLYLDDFKPPPGVSNHEYILTLADKSQYMFHDGTVAPRLRYKLKRRVWPTGEVWSYDYYDGTIDPPELDGKLKKVQDAYPVVGGNNRSLQFGYYLDSDPNAYQRRQLRRVGDQTASNLNGSTPSGRYVEFTYTPEKINANTVIETKALLQLVRDVRGENWTYDYYGQNSGESDIGLLNFLTKRQKPNVKAFGGGSTPQLITLEELTYSLETTSIALDGGMEVADPNPNWVVAGSVISNLRSNAFVDTGSFSRYVKVNGFNVGIESVNWALVPGRVYAITARVFLFTPGTVVMQVKGTNYVDTTSRERTWETLRIIYSPTGDAPQSRIQFVAGAGSTFPFEYYVDTVSVVQLSGIQQKRGNAAITSDFVFHPQGKSKTTQTIAGKTTTHYFANGVYIGAANPKGDMATQAIGSNYRPVGMVNPLGNTTQLEWNSTGNQLLKVKDANSKETVFAYNSNDTLQSILDVSGNRTLYTYGDSAQPLLPTEVKIVNPSFSTQRWMQYKYDNKGRITCELTRNSSTVPADPDVLAKTTRTYYSSGNGNGLLEKVTQHDLTGVLDATALDCSAAYAGNSVITTYTYDTAGRVTESKQTSFGDCCGTRTTYDDAGNILSVITIRDWSAPTDAVKNPVTTYTYDEMGRRISTTVNATTSDPQTSLVFYDGLNRVIRTITNYINQAGVSDVPGQWYWDNAWKQPNGTVISDGVNNDQNIINDTTYNSLGQIWTQRNPSGVLTYFVYDNAGYIRYAIVNYVAQGTSDPQNWVWNNTLKRWDYALNQAVSHGLLNNENIITEHQYDRAGNLVMTRDVLGNAQYIAYDKINRPVQTVQSAQDTATIQISFGDNGYQFSLDPRLDARSLNGYAPSAQPDRDFVEQTEYDPLGRIIKTRKLLDNRPIPQWVENRFTYDDIGQPIETNVNYSTTLGNGVNNDQNIVTSTFYRTNGLPMEVVDASGIATRYVFDTFGRQTRTIRNPSSGNSEDPNYIGDINDPAASIITQTYYDANGRVQRVKSVLQKNVTGTDLDWRWTLYGYDAQGRQVRVIQNASNSDYFTTHPSDASLSGYSPVTDSDKDIITDTAYDNLSRVFQSTDTRGNITRYMYDKLGRQIKTITNYVPQGNPVTDPANWVWIGGTTKRWEDGAGNAITFGSPDNDRNRITTKTYDVMGRVTNIRDSGGIETQYSYDILGRRTKAVENFDDGNYTPTQPDRDLITTTDFNRGGQVVKITDVRGTQTTFTYDRMGRRLTTTRAAGTALATISYSCYNKVGWTLRSIQNWVDNGTSPDTKDSGGNWLFAPLTHGTNNDENLITIYTLDLLGRQIQVYDPLGNLVSESRYQVNGLLDSTKQIQVDVSGTLKNIETVYRYDALGRRTRVVQNYTQTNDPTTWIWENNKWKIYSNGTDVGHGNDKDENIIVIVSYDKAGRTISLQNTLGNVTSYEYDWLDRRTKLKNPTPLNKEWLTAYTDLANGKTTTTVTYPGIANIPNYQIERTIDRLGRLREIRYRNAATDVYDLKYSYSYYSLAGTLSSLSEYSDPTAPGGSTALIRKTQYGYDQVRRPVSIGFDVTGDGNIDETVGYEYDAGSLRTKLKLPGNLNVTYTYNAKGELISLTDWDTQQSTMGYDKVGRHINTVRPANIRSDYSYDLASRLTKLKHTNDTNTLGYYEYTVDRRGNRLLATECIPHQGTGTSSITTAYNDKGILATPTASWSNSGSYRETTDTSAVLKLLFFGQSATLTLGKGNDYGKCDVYLNNTLVQNFDGYAASTTDGTVNLTPSPAGEGPHLVEIRNTNQKNPSSNGNRARFKTLGFTARNHTLHTIKYNYDGISRLKEARYNPGINSLITVDTDLLRRYAYTFDVVGNRLSQSVAIGGAAPTVTNYSYNVANQLTGDGTYTYEYDNNGNLRYKKQGTTIIDTYTFNRDNKLKQLGNISYTYDGFGNRIEQTIGSTTTKYLVDLQPSLAVMLSETTGANITRYIHSPRGIHAHKDASNNWEWMMQDGLGSVRGTVSNAATILESRHYDPFGTGFNATGTRQTDYDFTGERLDSTTGLVYLRARDYSPTLGVFPSHDTFEGVANRPMSLNGYMWVEANVPNVIDPSGECGQPTNWLDPIDANCFYSADGLAKRFSNGAPNLYQSYFDALIQKTWGQLKYYESVGTVSDASILPSLALREEPSLVNQSIREFFSGCGSPTTYALTIPWVLGQGATKTPWGFIAVGSILLGIGIGVFALLGLNTLVRDLKKDDDPCTEEKMEERIAGRSIGEVVGDVGNIRLGEPGLYKGVTPSGGKGVRIKAIEICKTGNTDPDYSEYYVCAPGLDCPHRILSDGDSAFVARRLMGQSLAYIEQNHLRASTARLGVGILEDAEDRDHFYSPRFDWATTRWLDENG